MSQRKILNQARQEVIQGKNRQEVFNAFLPQATKPRYLAMSIASVPHPDRKARWAVLNYILVSLLVLAALTKVLGALVYFFQYGAFVGLGALFLGILVPVAFAISIARFDGHMYLILIVLCAVSILNLLLRYKEHGNWVFVDVGFFATIMIVTWIVRQGLFPNIGIGVKKDAAGNFEL